MVLCFLPVGKRGIGLEVARHLVSQPCFVFLSGCDLLATKEDVVGDFRPSIIGIP